MQIPANHLGNMANKYGVNGDGIFAVIYPREMDDADAEFALDMLGMESRRIRRLQQQRHDAEAELFSWAGVATTG